MFEQEMLLSFGIVNCRGARQELSPSSPAIVGIELFNRNDFPTVRVKDCRYLDRPTSTCALSGAHCVWNGIRSGEFLLPPVKEKDPEHILRCITEAGEFVLDTTSGEITSPFLPKDKGPVKLTPSGCTITAELMREQGTTLTPRQLSEKIHPEYVAHVKSQAITHIIRDTRNKIGATPATYQYSIQTVRGQGFRFAAPPKPSGK